MQKCLVKKHLQYFIPKYYLGDRTALSDNIFKDSSGCKLKRQMRLTGKTNKNKHLKQEENETRQPSEDQKHTSLLGKRDHPSHPLHLDTPMALFLCSLQPWGFMRTRQLLLLTDGGGCMTILKLSLSEQWDMQTAPNPSQYSSCNVTY